MSKFLQIHTLTSYPASLLNRDDAGFAKRIPFGDAVRTRISSQCQKRHWRTFQGDGGLQEIGVPLALRSRITFQERVYKPLIKEGVAEDLAQCVTNELQTLVLGGKSDSDKAEKPEPAKARTAKGAKGKKGAEASAETESPEGADQPASDKGKGAGKTEQVTVLGVQEMDAVLAKARELLASHRSVEEIKKAVAALGDRKNKQWLENLRAMPASLDAALFGRMITGDVLADMDAAVHVAHAFTVHGEQSEPDYFSAVDELLAASGEDPRGSGHINTAELTSGLYYGYVAVDVDLLRQNVTGLRSGAHPDGEAVAREVLRRLVRIVATVTPGAKLGSTAPHARAQFVLLEAGDAQPRTLANAFLEPVRTGRGQLSLFASTCEALSAHVRELDAMYGVEFERRWAGVGVTASLSETLGEGNRQTLAELQSFAAWAMDAGDQGNRTTLDGRTDVVARAQ